jgi:riboflavin synthase
LFTGIVEAVGHVAGVAMTPRRDPSGAQAHGLEVRAERLFDELQTGASVAVNGVCLTLTGRRRKVGSFDVIPETWRSTNLRMLQPGQPVNLERSLRLGDRLEGHFVQGHIEGTGTIERLDRAGGEWKLWIRSPAELMRFIVPKGSIALDGTSLTVVDAGDLRFSVALIPTTLERTVLGRRRPGDLVNLETDLLARLVISRLAAAQPRPAVSPGLTLESLQAGGFA